MFYFFYHSIDEHKLSGKDSILLKLNNIFMIKDKKSGVLLTRDRYIHKLRILRILIPKLITKITIEPHRIKCKTRLEGLSFFLLIVFISGVIIEFKMDRVEYPRDYHPASPFILLSLFLVTAIIEAVIVKRKIEELLN